MSTQQCGFYETLGIANTKSITCEVVSYISWNDQVNSSVFILVSRMTIIRLISSSSYHKLSSYSHHTHVICPHHSRQAMHVHAGTGAPAINKV